MGGEQFAVLMFLAEGERRYVRRFVSAQEAVRAFEHCMHRGDCTRQRALNIPAWSLA
jgi:hypothetical protein